MGNDTIKIEMVGKVITDGRPWWLRRDGYDPDGRWTTAIIHVYYDARDSLVAIVNNQYSSEMEGTTSGPLPSGIPDEWKLVIMDHSNYYLFLVPQEWVKENLKGIY